MTIAEILARFKFTRHYNWWWESGVGYVLAGQFAKVPPKRNNPHKGTDFIESLKADGVYEYLNAKAVEKYGHLIERNGEC